MLRVLRDTLGLHFGIFLNTLGHLGKRFGGFGGSWEQVRILMYFRYMDKKNGRLEPTIQHARLSERSADMSLRVIELSAEL